MHSFFGPRSTTVIHIAEAILLVCVLIMSIVRIAINGGIKSRSDSMSLAMAAKSVVFLSYQLLSEHTKFFRKWASLKAYFIINCAEIVFWAAVAFLVIQATIQRCIAPTCALSWVIVVLAINMSVLMAYASLVTWNNWQAAKRGNPSPMVLQSVDRTQRDEDMAYTGNPAVYNKTMV